jgi:hypothetical protein
VPLQVYAITRSSLDVGLIGLAARVPLVVFGLYGGSIADAVDRRKLVLPTSTATMLVSAVLLVQAVLQIDRVSDAAGRRHGQSAPPRARGGAVNRGVGCGTTARRDLELRARAQGAAVAACGCGCRIHAARELHVLGIAGSTGTPISSAVPQLRHSHSGQSAPCPSAHGGCSNAERSAHSGQYTSIIADMNTWLTSTSRRSHL